MTITHSAKIANSSEEPQFRNYFLTSTAITYNKDGDYSFDETALLLPHETLRRQMIMMGNAMINFDLITHPWKISALSRWYKEFFCPIVHEHHDIEEQIWFPEYKEKGATYSEKITDDHVILLSQLESVNKTINFLHSIIETGQNNSDYYGKVSEMTGILKEQVKSLIKLMLEHFSEEEEVWPPIFRQFGREFYGTVEEKIVKKVLSTPGDVTKFGLAALVQSIGYFPTGKLPSDIPGWSSELFIIKFLKTVPYPVRALLLPLWDRKYNKYKSMIVSCTGDVDTKAYVRDPGCQCILS